MTRAGDIEGIEAALRAMLPKLRTRRPVSWLGVLGSRVRREQRDGGDLDLLVFEDEIERRLGLPVDRVMRGSLRRRIRRKIQGEAQPV